MYDLARIRYVTEHYHDLQGLIRLPVSLWLLGRGLPMISGGYTFQHGSRMSGYCSQSRRYPSLP